ncbi:MAG TPA: hypothetical protein VG165_05095 [Solirubrobacteraceae bacterium]|nr:hypothetical protein [Solirubrobacteraceae bacterium]
MEETSFVRLPPEVRSPYEVYVNGVHQKLGTDYQVRDGMLCFRRRLAKDTISKKRWLIGAFGVGTYRQNDSVDVRYETPRGVRLAEGLAIEDPASPPAVRRS